MIDKNHNLQKRLLDLEEKHQKMLSIVKTAKMIKHNAPNSIYCDCCKRGFPYLRYTYSKDDLDICLECVQDLKDLEHTENSTILNNSRSFFWKLKTKIGL
jgi:hypothetical protein